MPLAIRSQRDIPSFGLDPAEVRQLASPGCPPSFITLALDCANVDPAARPKMNEVLGRLRIIELEILARSSGSGEHVGSLKLIPAGGGGGRPNIGKRIPSFGQGIGKDIRSSSSKIAGQQRPRSDHSNCDDGTSSGEEGNVDVEDLNEILNSLGKKGGGALTVDGGTWRTARWGDDGDRRPDGIGSSGFTTYADSSEMRGALLCR